MLKLSLSFDLFSNIVDPDYFVRVEDGILLGVACGSVISWMILFFKMLKLSCCCPRMLKLNPQTLHSTFPLSV